MMIDDKNIGKTMPQDEQKKDPESAKDTLEEEHKIGLRLHDTSEDIEKVDIASERVE